MKKRKVFAFTRDAEGQPDGMIISDYHTDEVLSVHELTVADLVSLQVMLGRLIVDGQYSEEGSRRHSEVSRASLAQSNFPFSDETKEERKTRIFEWITDENNAEHLY